MTDKLDAERLRALDENNALGVSSYLYSNRAAILAMAEERDRMREALERCRALVQQHNHRQNEKIEDVVHVVNRALGESQP